MKSYGFIVPVALGIGLALFGPLLWHLRKEMVFGWREQFGIGGDDEILVKERAEVLRSMEPFGWGIIVLLTAIMVVMMFVLGIVVAHGGVALYVVGAIVIIALIVLFNIVLFSQFPPLPSGGGRAARR